jgi:putative membrane protein
LLDPFVAGALQISVLLLWHAPALFIAAQRSDGVHTVMHLSLFGAGALYWWSIFRAASLPGVKPLIAAFVTLVTTKVSLMFALIMLSADAAFYPETYAAAAAAWSTTALADQQLAAIVMLAPGAVVYLTTAVALAWIWVREMDGNAESRRSGATIPERGPLEGDTPSRATLT